MSRKLVIQLPSPVTRCVKFYQKHDAEWTKDGWMKVGLCGGVVGIFVGSIVGARKFREMKEASKNWSSYHKRTCMIDTPGSFVAQGMFLGGVIGFFAGAIWPITLFTGVPLGIIHQTAVMWVKD